MSTKTTQSCSPIFASSFLRHSSLSTAKAYHRYATDNTECVPLTDTSSTLEWLHSLSLISTRFMQVSWRVLHDLQIAPPSNTNQQHLHNHDEWVMVELCYNGVRSVSCIQTTPSPSDDDRHCDDDGDETPVIRLSPLLICDLHIPFTLDTNHPALVTLNDTHNNNASQISLRSIDFHNFPVAKTVRFQLITSTSSSRNATDANYNELVTKYLAENKINGIELMKDDYFVHHKCIWKGQIVAIPIICSSNDDAKNNSQNTTSSLRGRKALTRFYASKHRQSNSSDRRINYRVEYWLYIKIVDIINSNNDASAALNNDENDRYSRILPTVTQFMRLPTNTNSEQPRLCEYFSSMLLHRDEHVNGNNLYLHYKLPAFYSRVLHQILFPNIYYNRCKHINPSFLMICNRGHRLTDNLQQMAKQLGVNFLYKHCVDLLGSNMSATVQHVSNFVRTAVQYHPLILQLDGLDIFEFEANIHAFYKSSGKIKPVLPVVHVLQQCLSAHRTRHKLVVFGSADNMNRITREMRAIFTYEHVIESMFDKDEKEVCATEVIPSNLEPFIAELNLINGLNTTQLFEIASQLQCHVGMQKQKQLETLQNAVDKIRHRQSLYNVSININVSSIPSVKWSDVGGLETAKQEIMNIIDLPLQYSSVFAHIKQSSGILLYGPPGTGKTLLAKAIATEFKMNFISIKGPELLNPFVGQSEENIRDVFAKAVQSRPCILFFDEIDALVPSRGKAADGGNVMDRVVSQLLTELDLVVNQHNGSIFIIAATNRPDLLDASLLRPKRLDKQIYLGLPETVADKLKIVQALTRKFEFLETDEMTKMDILQNVVQHPNVQSLTGADLYALCCDAMMVALKLLIAEIQSLMSGYERQRSSGGGGDDDVLSMDLLLELIQNGKRNALEQKYGLRISDEQWQRIKDFEVKLQLLHFEEALKGITPSLTPQEILQYQSIHRK